LGDLCTSGFNLSNLNSESQQLEKGTGRKDLINGGRWRRDQTLYTRESIVKAFKSEVQREKVIDTPDEKGIKRWGEGGLKRFI